MDRQNRLLNNYTNHQQNNVPFQNNALLQNNVMFRNSMANNNSRQIRTMNILQQQLKNIDQITNMEQLENINNNINIRKEDVIFSVIRPMKIEKNNSDAIEINNKFNDAKGNFVVQRTQLWEGRTNQPYKNIMKNEDYNKAFKNEKDLIVHKVTAADKIEKILLKELESLEGEIEKHDSELKSIYSLSEKTKHLKKFDYEHVVKYERIKYDPAEFIDMKMDRMDILKREQKKIEGNKKKIDEVFNDLINKGIIDDVQKEMSNYENNDVVNNDDINIDDFERELNMPTMTDKKSNTINKNANDDEYIKKLENELGISNVKNTENKKSTQIKNGENKKSTKIKTTIKTRPKNQSSDEIIAEDNKKQSSVSDEIKNKYRNRQKNNR